MHSAPPVLVPVGRFVWGVRLVWWLAVGSALGGVLTVAEGWQSAHAGRTAWIGVAWCLVAMAGWWASRFEFLPPGELSWDGEAWWYRVNGGRAQAVRLALRWDAGRAMLLGLCPDAPGLRMERYIWVAASQQPRQWHALRCAVHARDTL